MNIAIVGATGNVGRKMLEVLEQKKLPIDELYLVASSRSVGKILSFNGKDYEVYNLEAFDFSKAQITFFAAGSKISEEYALKAAKYSSVSLLLLSIYFLTSGSSKSGFCKTSIILG